VPTNTGRFVLLATLALLIGCGPSTEDLSKQVTESMQHKLDSDPMFSDMHLAVRSISLIHASGNVYQGIASVSSASTTHEVSVKVTADGTNMFWQTDPGAFLVFYGDGALSLPPTMPAMKVESIEQKAIRLVRRDYDIKPEEPSSVREGNWSAYEIDSMGQNYRAVNVGYAVPGAQLRCEWVLIFPLSDSHGYSLAKMNESAQTIFYSVPTGSHGNN
jgi:hypothetical protein